MNKANIEKNTYDINVNKANIEKNTYDINVNKANIEKNTYDINVNKANIEKNTYDINENKADIGNVDFSATNNITVKDPLTADLSTAVRDLDAAVGNVASFGDTSYEGNAEGAVNVVDAIQKIDEQTSGINRDGTTTKIENAVTIDSTGKIDAVSGALNVEGVSVQDGTLKVAGKYEINADGSASLASGKYAVNADGSYAAASGKYYVDKDGNVASKGSATFEQNLGVHGDAAVEGTATFGTVAGAQTTINGGTIVANDGSNHKVVIDATGLKVGKNSVKLDDNGIYVGTNTAGTYNYDTAKAAMSNADGSLKAASGLFEVEGTTGKTTIIDNAGNYTELKSTDVSIGGSNDVERIYLSDLGQVDDIDAELQARTEYDKTAVGGINAEAAIRREEVARLDSRIDQVDKRLDKVGAMSAAIANLRTMGYDPAAPSEFAMSLGHYRGETGMAIGFFHYPHKDFMLSLSVSGAGDEYMGGVGATWKFGHRSPERMAEIEKSKAAKAKLAKALAEKKAKEAQDDAAAAIQSAKHAKMIK